ncbi:MAG: hypothetical protein WKF91_06835 [Segetibacter sp.]
MKRIVFAILCCTTITIFTACNKELELQNTNTPPTNTAPIARAGADQTITLSKDSVMIDGSSSSDADGKIAFYSWSKISGPSSFHIVTPDSVKTIINQLAQGVYLFELNVKDNGGLSAKDTV